MNQELVLVLGRLCSGKGTYCASYVERDFHHIATSDVVKSVSGAFTRSDLQNTKSLDVKIADALIALANQYERVVIDGIRQSSIIRAIEKEIPHVQLVWLEADTTIRKQRFEQRKDRKDNITFEQAEQGDDNLGLSQVESDYKSKCKIIHNG